MDPQVLFSSVSTGGGLVEVGGCGCDEVIRSGGRFVLACTRCRQWRERLLGMNSSSRSTFKWFNLGNRRCGALVLLLERRQSFPKLGEESEGRPLVV